MTGLKHYREAEKLLVTAAGLNGGPPAAEYLAAAQVHATLALAAATAQGADGPAHGPGYVAALEAIAEAARTIAGVGALSTLMHRELLVGLAALDAVPAAETGSES